jgi:hypothetical protein
VPFTVNNFGERVEWSLSPSGQASWGSPLVITASAAGASSILVVHQGRPVGSIDGDRGELVLDPQVLGLGPVSLQAVAIGSGEEAPFAFSAPVDLEILPPVPLPDQGGLARSATAEGVAVTLANGSSSRAASTEVKDWLASAGVERRQPFEINGYFEIDAETVYQFQTQFAGRLVIAVDGVPLLEETVEEQSFRYVPVALEAGWHSFTLQATLDDLREFRIDFGDAGVYPLSKAGFRCEP